MGWMFVENPRSFAMRKIFLLFITVCGMAYTGLGSTPPSANRPTLTKEDKEFYHHCILPNPPYPLQARARHYQGSGYVKVTFDERGRASSVVMKQSTRSRMLDANTIAFAQANWRSSGGMKKTILVPVTYVLRPN